MTVGSHLGSDFINRSERIKQVNTREQVIYELRSAMKFFFVILLSKGHCVRDYNLSGLHIKAQRF